MSDCSNAPLSREIVAARALSWVETAFDPLAYLDLDLRVLYANPAFGRFAGVDGDLCVGRDFVDLVPFARSATHVIAAIRRAGSERNRQDTEFPSDDERASYLFSARPDFDGDELVGYVVAARDITVLRQIERTLHEREVEFRTLAENSPDNIVRFGLDGRATYCNVRIGGRVSRVVGRRPTESTTFDPEQMVEYERLVRRALDTGEPGSVIISIPGEPSERRVHEVLIRAERGPDGKITSALAIGRDITDLVRAREEIAAKEREFRSLAENANDCIIRWSVEGTTLYANPAFARQRGVEPSELVGAPAGWAVDPAYAAMRDVVMDAISTGEPRSVEHVALRAVGGGAGRIHEVQLVPERDQHGAVVSVLGVGRDITALLEANAEIAAKEREFRSLAENASDVIARWSVDGIVLYANPALAAMYGVEPSQLIGTPARWWVDPRFERLRDAVAEAVSTGRSTSVELTLTDLDEGEQSPVHEVQVVPERDPQGTVVSVLGIGRDVTGVVRHREELERLARTDSLTGIANRQVLYEQGAAMLDDARRHGQRLGLMLLDLDGFKHVNDRLGHRTGDELLRAVASRLRACVRSGDLLVRLGGDEFVVVVADVRDHRHMDQLAERVRLSLTEISTLDAVRVARVEASVGIVVSPFDGETIDVLLAHADMAMYQAKRNGRGRVEYFRSELTTAIERRRVIEQSLIEQRFEEGFELHLQPVFALDPTPTIVGAEALARWDHPELGKLSPAEFIPVAEESGRIVGLGRWALRRAAEIAVQCNRGRAEPVRIGVNVSTRQFALDDVAAAVRSAIASTGCDPHWLTIELTESLLLEDSFCVQRTLDELRRDGVDIAIDDFGMGYSALHYLARFPVDHLKIDRSFVEGIGADDRRTELVRAFMALAQALGLQPIAEGIETVEQLEFLRELGCGHGQGFLLARPMLPGDFDRLLNAGVLTPGAGVAAGIR